MAVAADASWDDFRARVSAMDWSRSPSPDNPSHGPYDSVPDAFEALLAASTHEASRAAYNVTLDAVGHNHSGTVYPVFITALPFLIELALRGGTWTCFGALEVMIDALAWTFAPRDASRAADPLDPDPVAARACFDGVFDQILALTRSDLPPRVRKSAQDLLDLLTHVP